MNDYGAINGSFAPIYGDGRVVYFNSDRGEYGYEKEYNEISGSYFEIYNGDLYKYENVSSAVVEWVSLEGGQSESWDLNGNGIFTINESYNWWKNGNRRAVRVPLGNIDLSSITPKQFPRGVGSVQSFNLLFRGNIRDGLVHGTISLRLYPNNTVKAFDDRYNFDYKPWWGNTTRNIENFFGKTIHGQGTPFKIDFIGIGTISPNRNIFSPNNPGLLKPWEPKY